MARQPPDFRAGNPDVLVMHLDYSGSWDIPGAVHGLAIRPYPQEKHTTVFSFFPFGSILVYVVGV